MRPGERWQLRVAGLPLTIERMPDGRWVALYGGFSRAASRRLSDAIAVAACANGREPWVGEIARRVEDAAVAGRSDLGG
jgi:hypothetical protein